MPLTGSQRRFLRALGHHLNPIVQVGHQGVTEGVIAALNQALLDHELVKVRFGRAIDERDEAAVQLAEGTGGELVQALGRTVLVYRPHPDEPKIEVPPPRRPAK